MYMKVINDNRSEYSHWNIEARKTFRALTGLEIHCDDHLSLSYTSAVHI